MNMKFRLLRQEELEVFSEELKQFLIVHGIHGPEWEYMNREHPDKAIELVEIFSDTILEKVYNKISFLEHRSIHNCLVFKIDENVMELISLQAKSERDDIDLSTAEGIHKALVEQTAGLNCFVQKKNMQKTKAEEVHLLIEQGCLISSHEFWDALQKVIREE